MFSILTKLPPGRFGEAVGSYFTSIHGILSHLYGSDVLRLQRIRACRPRLEALHGSELDMQISWPSGELFNGIQEFLPKREALDAPSRPGFRDTLTSSESPMITAA
jgi:hypothetical protein